MATLRGRPAKAKREPWAKMLYIRRAFDLSLTQEELADLVPGFDQRSISDIELSKRNPLELKASQLAAYVRALQWTMPEFEAATGLTLGALLDSNVHETSENSVLVGLYDAAHHGAIVRASMPKALLDIVAPGVEPTNLVRVPLVDALLCETVVREAYPAGSTFFFDRERTQESGTALCRYSGADGMARLFVALFHADKTGFGVSNHQGGMWLESPATVVIGFLTTSLRIER